MGKFNMGNKITSAVFAGFIAFSTLSCNLGLGSSVDTEKPKVFVTDELTTGKIIKGPFVLSGTCSDDTGVGSVKIVLTNSDSGASYEYVVSASEMDRPLDENGKLQDAFTRKDSWAITLNEKVTDENDVSSYPLGDGKYNVTVTAIDSSEEKKASVSVERTIIIDNTAPLLVLSRPATNDSYGRFFSVSGRVADDSNIDTLEIDVFNIDAPEDAQPLYTIVKNNIAPTIDINAAVFGAEGEDGPYEKIYGKNGDEGTKQFKCKIRIYDAARNFPAVEGDKGNCASIFYMDEDEKLSNYTNSFTVSDLYHILSGSYSRNSDRAADEVLRKEVEAWLKNVDEAHQITTFSLNPENSPKFSLIGGYAAVKNYEAIRGSEALNDENIVVKVDAGRDGIAIDPESLGISVMEVEEDSSRLGENEKALWKPVEGAQKIEIVKPRKENPNSQALIEQSGTSYTITTKVSKSMGLKIGKTYILDVTGCDLNGNAVNNISDYYGFYFASKGLAPTLKVNEPAGNTLYIKAGEKVTVSGTVEHEAGIPNVLITIKKFGSEDSRVFSSANGDFAIENKVFSKTFEISDFVENPSENAQYDVSVISTYGAYSSGEVYASGEIQKIVMYDVTNPEISQISVLPIADTRSIGGNDHNVNGRIILSGSFNDANSESDTGVDIDSMRCVYVSKEGEKEVKIQSQQNWKIEIDTTTVQEGNLDVTFYVKDKSGNETSKTLYFDDESKTKYIVDQSTDNPLIVMEEQINKVSAYNDANISPLAKRHSLTGIITDDDGLKDFVISVYAVDKQGNVSSENQSEVYGKTQALNGATSKQLSQQLPSDDGVYKVVVSATDEKSNGETSVSSVWETFLKIAGDSPTIVVQEGNNSVIKTDSDLKLTLKYSGNTKDGPLHVYLLEEQNKKDPTKWFKIYETQVEDGVATGTATVSVPKELRPVGGEGEHKVVIRIEANGLTTDDELVYRIDDSKPSVPVITGWESTGNKVQSVNNQIEIKTVDAGLAGINKLYYKYNDAENWSELAGSGTFNLFQKFGSADGEVPEGTGRITLKSEDKALNESDVQVYYFVADSSAPELSLKKDSKEIENITFNNDYEFDVETKDEQSGISSLKINGAVFTENKYKVVETGDYTFVAENGSGLKTEKTVHITIDRVAPTVVITKVDPEENGWFGDVKKIDVSGTADDGDGSGVMAVYYHCRDPQSDSTPAIPANVFDNDAWHTNGWDTGYGTVSWRKPEQDIGENEERDSVRIVDVIAVDYAGNISGIFSRPINKDKSAPSVTLKITDSNNKINPISTSDKEMEFEYSASDSWGLKDGYPKVYINGTETSVAQNLFKLSSPVDGNYTVKVVATDKANKTSEIERSIILDTTGPTVIVSEPVDGWLCSKNVVFKGSALDIDNLSEVSQVYYSAPPKDPNSPPVWLKAIGTLDWTVSVNEEDTNGKEYSFVAVDSLGNIGVVTKK